jgi:hypothetical protein
MTNKSPSDRPRSSRGTWLGIAAILAAVALALPVFLGSSLSSVGRAGTANDGRSVGARQSPEEIVASAIEEMDAIASASGDAMAEAGAMAAAEYDMTTQAAAQATAQAAATAEMAVEAAGEVGGALEAPPSTYTGGNVTPPPGSGQVPTYPTPTFEGEVRRSGEPTVTPYQGTDSEVKARAALNIPVTGIGPIDAAGAAVVHLYIDLKNNVQATGNDTIGWDDSTFGTVWYKDSELSYSAAPDDQGAQAAADHARKVMAAAEATFESLLSGVNVTVEAQAELLAEVEAEIDATMEAQEKAEAAIETELEARIKATLEAEAQASAEARAQAERRIEVIQSARAQAKQAVHQKAEQQVEVVTSAAVAAAESLRQQAGAAASAGNEAAARIEAEAQRAVAALVAASGPGASAGAQAQAIMKAAAEASAKARTKANATAQALLEQSASVMAQADVKVKLILSAEAKASAAIDAAAEVAVKATLRAEAYTQARIKAAAKAAVEAHVKAAAKAKAKSEAAAKAHIRAVIRAAVGINAAAAVSVNGARGMGDLVEAKHDAAVTRDIEYVRQVESDYRAKPPELDTQQRAEHWKTVAEDLELEKSLVTDVKEDLDFEVDRSLQLIGQTGHELWLLGQRYN